MKNQQKIFMYHSIGSVGGPEVGAGLYCVSVEKFREQMELVQSSKSKVQREILITFDDGLVDNYTNAYSILKEFGLKGYFFVLVGKVGTAGYMDWKQLRQLRDGGMVIGSHGMTHRILTELNDKELDYELKNSKAILENKLGHRIDFLSIPRGFYNKKAIDKAKEAGYKAIFTSNFKDNAGCKFGRIPVKSNWGKEYFARVINKGPSLRSRVEESVKGLSKKILGVRKYDRIRNSLLK